MNYLILALATWRLASFLVHEDGPFEIFARFRSVVGVQYAPDGLAIGTNWFAKGVSCVWCLTVWIAFVWAIAYWLWEPVTWVALPFALSAGAIMVEEFLNDV